MAQQSIITQVTRDNESYQPAPAPDRGTMLNSSVTTSARGKSVARQQKKLDKYGNTWCVCNWLFACFRKDDPPIASTTFQNEVPQPPEDCQPNKYLLPPRMPEDEARKCIIIDLDETLVHSSFKPVNNADFVVPVEIDNVIHQVYVLKRPHCDEFLRRMGEMFECILFTASLSKYADPVSDLLDKHHSLSGRLFREHCVFHRGNYVKDLSKLGRDLKRVVIIDNSPQSYVFHPDNAVPVSSWFDDPKDTELLDLIPFFEALDKVDNVLTILSHSQLPFQNTLGMNNTKLPN